MLMQLEQDRREHNRVNKENLDLYTYLCSWGGFYLPLDVITFLEFSIFKTKRKNHYLRHANYNNYKKVGL